MLKQGINIIISAFNNAYTNLKISRRNIRKKPRALSSQRSVYRLSPILYQQGKRRKLLKNAQNPAPYNDYDIRRKAGQIRGHRSIGSRNGRYCELISTYRCANPIGALHNAVKNARYGYGEAGNGEHDIDAIAEQPASVCGYRAPLPVLQILNDRFNLLPARKKDVAPVVFKKKFHFFGAFCLRHFFIPVFWHTHHQFVQRA